MEYITIFIAILVSFILFCYNFREKGGLPTNWPLIGMLPALHKNTYRIHGFVTELIQKSQEMTFYIKGPWFANSNFYFTVDPSNINHVFSRNFGNYGKGTRFHEIFEILGDGIFNADNTLWQYHRKLSHSFFNHPKFQPTLVGTIWDELETSLIPLLDNASQNNIEIDILDVFIRFTFDNICTILLNRNPKFLSIDLPHTPFASAIERVEQVIFRRHLIPRFIWKSMKWLGVGEEQNKQDAQTIDDFLYSMIASKREEINNKFVNKDVEVSFDLLTFNLNEEDGGVDPIIKRGDKFIRDTILNLIIAGGNTIGVSFSWFLYMFTIYPEFRTKLREELGTFITQSEETFEGFFKNFHKHNNKFVYFNAAIYETLRLYPPLRFNHKASIKPEMLPSGHQLGANASILFDIYTMGRMKSIWGDDCDQFKPERWINERGNLKLEPTYKFVSFGAGPRVCQGKDMAFTQLKVVLATIILKYDVEVVKGHQVVPEPLGFILFMKHGLKVKLKQRRNIVE